MLQQIKAASRVLVPGSLFDLEQQQQLIKPKVAETATEGGSVRKILKKREKESERESNNGFCFIII